MRYTAFWCVHFAFVCLLLESLLLARKRSPKQMRNVDKRLIGYRNFVNTKRGLGCHADTSYSNIQLRFSIYYERSSSGCEVKGTRDEEEGNENLFFLIPGVFSQTR